MKQTRQNWEKQFDKKFINSFAGVPCVCKVNNNNVEFFLPKELKQFISDLSKAQRKDLIKKIEDKVDKIEYCDGGMGCKCNDGSANLNVGIEGTVLEVKDILTLIKKL